MSHLRKLIAYARLYGPRRALVKALGRTRLPVTLARGSSQAADIAVVGCGQFAFSTIGHFLTRRFGTRILWCFDPATEAAQSFARCYGVPRQAATTGEWNADPSTRYVYVASNHGSHSDHAVASLEQGKTVYIEKPVAVSVEQLRRLERARAQSSGQLFAGYNRPFSPAIGRLRTAAAMPTQTGFTLACHVCGHRLAPDHWYRRPGEGSRICGNAGHWVDLFVHLCGWRGALPDRHRISLQPASLTDRDDNFSLSIATDRDEILSLVLTSRHEPFEGVRETIHFQNERIDARIDDFRSLTIREGPRRRELRFRPKDVGHEAAIMQPFGARPGRAWDEVLRSSLLTLRIAEMASAGATTLELSMASELAALRRDAPE